MGLRGGSVAGVTPYVDTVPARRAQLQNHFSYLLSPRGINLPSGLNLTQPLVERVAAALTGILTEEARRGSVARQAA